MEEGEVCCKNFSKTKMDYNKIEIVGEGTYAQVFASERNNVVYALKRMNKHRDGIPLTTIREIKLLRKLRHPNIIRLKEIIIDKNDCNEMYMVFPFYKYDLYKFIKSKRIFTAKKKTILFQIVNGLLYLHRNGIIHRDLKSANILLNNVFDVCIADFGISRYVNKNSAHTPGVVTLWYRAPELVLGAEEYSFSVDIWSLGCIAAEMVLGKPLFCGNTEIEQIETIIHYCGSINDKSYPNAKKLPHFDKFKLPQSPGRLESIFNGEEDKDLISLIIKMLNLDPAKRPDIEELSLCPYLMEEKNYYEFDKPKKFKY